jgi:DNA-binding transcriptional LysR family regulator
MNVHQLELFYHLAVHRGVSAAARALDKEQPTLSKQINDLENGLHVKLYHRRPFRLTKEGETLFRRIEPFFRNLIKLEAQVRGGDCIRIGASPVILAEHLPSVEKEVRRRFPHLHIVLREANQPQLVQWLESGEIDLAITLLPVEVPQKTFAQPLLPMPLVLLTLKTNPLRSADQLWKQSEVNEPLVCLAPDDLVCRLFQSALKRLGVRWRPAVEVASLDLVAQYVMRGFGIGLGLRAPGVKLSPKLRTIELPGIPVPSLGMLWRDDQDKLLRLYRARISERARRIRSDRHD